MARTGAQKIYKGLLQHLRSFVQHAWKPLGVPKRSHFYIGSPGFNWKYDKSLSCGLFLGVSKLFKNHWESCSKVKGYLRLKYVAECICPQGFESNEKWDKIKRIENTELIVFTINTSVWIWGSAWIHFEQIVWSTLFSNRSGILKLNNR